MLPIEAYRPKVFESSVYILRGEELGYIFLNDELGECAVNCDRYMGNEMIRVAFQAGGMLPTWAHALAWMDAGVLVVAELDTWRSNSRPSITIGVLHALEIEPPILCEKLPQSTFSFRDTAPNGDPWKHGM